MNPQYKYDIAIINSDNDIFRTFNATHNAEISPVTGDLVESPLYDTTDYLEIAESRYYVAYTRIVAFYDTDKAFVGSVVNDGGRYMYNVINTPKNARYARITGDWRANGVLPHMCVSKAVKPVYKADLTLSRERERDERYYREKLSGKMTFIRNDFKYIMLTAFDTEYILVLWISDDGGKSWKPLHRAKFSRTDCKVNEDDKSVEVSPESMDEYTEIIAGMDKEYNLTELAPAIDAITIYKRPLMQIYIAGDDVASCFLSGAYWEEDAEVVSDPSLLINKYKFGLSVFKRIVISPGQAAFGTNGEYLGHLLYTDEGVQTIYPEYVGRLYAADNPEFYMLVSIVAKDNLPLGFVLVELRKRSNDEVYYRYERKTQGKPFDEQTFVMETPAGSGRYGRINAEMTSYDIYSRYILDVEQYAGESTFVLPVDDIVGNNHNYRRVKGVEGNNVSISTRAQETPTEWGKRDDGKYFAPPSELYGDKYYPVARSLWTNISFWFHFSRLDWQREAEGRKGYELRDAFPIWSVIQVILKKIAPGIRHEGTPEYSQFLYGDKNPITGDKFRVYISPKSNIINGEYKTPAQKSPIMLQQVTEMLKKVYKCYWYIEDGKFKIEHVQYFRNGGTYTPGDPVIGYDLTQMENTRNTLPWAYNTTSYTYEKTEMPARYEFQWMDDVTENFQGRPIEILSNFVDNGKVEKIDVSEYTTDIDMMILNPGNMSKDGYALFATVDADIIAEQYVPGSLIVSGTDDYTMPAIAIKPGYGGHAAILRCIPTGGGTGVVTFTLKGGTIYDTPAIVQGNGKYQELHFNIPMDAESMSVEVTGTLNIDVRGIMVPDARQLPFVSQKIDNVQYVMQNGLMAFSDIQPKYWLYDMPAFRLRINNEPVRAASISRRKKQEVRFPVTLPVITLNAVKTFLGNGEIEKINVNLSSNQAKATLIYDTTE